MCVVLQPGSLFCFSGELYSDYKHEIPETTADVVPVSCANAAAAGVRIGDVLDCSGCSPALMAALGALFAEGSVDEIAGDPRVKAVDLGEDALA